MLRSLACAMAIAALSLTPAAAQTTSPGNTIRMETTKGMVTFVLRPDVAPQHAERFKLLIREKFYVLLAKDRVGFFVLHYTAPSSVFAEHLPVFEKLASSFELL